MNWTLVGTLVGGLALGAGLDRIVVNVSTPDVVKTDVGAMMQRDNDRVRTMQEKDLEAMRALAGKAPR